MNTPRLYGEYPLFAGCDPDLHTLSIAYLRGGSGVPWVESILLFKTKGSRKEQAVLDMLGELEEVSPVHAYGSPHLLTAYAVESQDTSYTGRKNAAQVSDIVTLSQVAGGVSLWLREAAAVRSLGILVKPSAWKGSVPKGVHQCRTLRKLGIEYTMMGGLSPYPVPRGLDDLVSGAKLNKSDWKDINDSIGLALYAWEKWNLVEGVV